MREDMGWCLDNYSKVLQIIPNYSKKTQNSNIKKVWVLAFEIGLR